MKCKNCGKQFNSKRKDAVFCSDKCRKEAFLKRTDNNGTDKLRTDKVVKSGTDKVEISADIKALSRQDLKLAIDAYPTDTWKDSPEFAELKHRLKTIPLKKEGYWIPNGIEKHSLGQPLKVKPAESKLERKVFGGKREKAIK